MKMEIEFPGDEPYGRCLGRLRKAVKPYVPNLHVRRRRTGALISGSPEKVSVVPLILPSGYRIIEWDPDTDSTPRQQSALE
jgi:hypothetical protein